MQMLPYLQHFKETDWNSSNVGHVYRVHTQNTVQLMRLHGHSHNLNIPVNPIQRYDTG